MRKSIVVMLLAAAVVTGWCVASGDGQDDTKRAFMRAKLNHAQRVLEALALEDYQGMAHHAEQLRLLSLDSNWQVLSTEQYVRHSADFRRSAGSLANAAEKRNLDRALLAYYQMTHSCIECHRHVREDAGR